jgi:hypothetical protein
MNTVWRADAGGNVTVGLIGFVKSKDKSEDVHLTCMAYAVGQDIVVVAGVE